MEPAPENIAFHDGTRFLSVEETNAAIAEFDRLEADLISAHNALSNTPGLPDRAQAEVMDSSSPVAGYFRQAINLEFTAAADVPIVIDCPVTAIDLSGRGGDTGHIEGRD